VHGRAVSAICVNCATRGVKCTTQSAASAAVVVIMVVVFSFIQSIPEFSDNLQRCQMYNLEGSKLHAADPHLSKYPNLVKQ